MAIVKDPVQRAKDVTTKLQAARLHLELEAELGLNEHLPDGWEKQAEDALQMLGKAWGGEDALRDHDVAGAGGMWGPSLSKHANNAITTLKTGGGPRRAAAASHPKVQQARRAGQQRRGGGASSRVNRGARKAWKQTGVPGATASGSQIVLQVLGMTIGLSALYLLLTNARGASTLFGGLQTALRVIVDPVDPLRPSGKPASTSSAPAKPSGKAGAAGTAELAPSGGAAAASGTAELATGTTKTNKRRAGRAPIGG